MLSACPATSMCKHLAQALLLPIRFLRAHRQLRVVWSLTKAPDPECAPRGPCELIACLKGMPMSVRVSMCTYIHYIVHPCMHSCTYIHTYIHLYIRTYIHTDRHTYVRTLHTCIQHTYTHRYIHTYIRTYLQKYTRTTISHMRATCVPDVYTCTQTYRCRNSSKPWNS